MHVDNVNENGLPERKLERADQADGHRRRRRECAVTRKAAEVADKFDARRRHQREQAATRKSVETADQADAPRVRKKEWVARRRASRYKASESLHRCRKFGEIGGKTPNWGGKRQIGGLIAALIQLRRLNIGWAMAPSPAPSPARPLPPPPSRPSLVLPLALVLSAPPLVRSPSPPHSPSSYAYEFGCCHQMLLLLKAKQGLIMFVCLVIL